MATINASTKHVISSTKSSATPPAVVKKGVGKSTSTASTIGPSTNSAGVVARRGAVAPPLKVATQTSALDTLITKAKEKQQSTDSHSDNTADPVAAIVLDMFKRVQGEHTTFQLNKPHAASTTRDRAGAAADLAYITNKHLGLPYVLSSPCNILNEIQRTLFPNGINSLTTRGGGTDGGGIDTNSTTTDGDSKGLDNNSNGEGVPEKGNTPGTILSTIKPSISALSLASLVDEGQVPTTTTSASIAMNTDGTVDSMTERGRTTPPNAREGCLLLIRALIESCGKSTEPYFVGAFLAAALDECASSSSSVREAAEDTCTALISICSPYSFRPIIAPILLQSLQCPEWRIKSAALDKLTQCCTSCSVEHKLQVYNSIPTLVPALTNQVWDTKAQVSKAARTALTAVCNTNTNADIRPTIPALVNAICKPSDTNKAVTELMGTTFVVPVDAAVLTILCPLLARALKEKMAIHKRAACIVISNMSKLVDKPASIAPFGNLLVPELQRVARNVQFEEIRDEALRALANLTKALGDHFNTQRIGIESDGTVTSPPVDTIATTETVNDKAKQQLQLQQQKEAEEAAAIAEELLRENELVRQEQERIRIEREKEAARLEEIRIQEEEERRRFKEAMDAQRELDKIAENENRSKREAEELQREKQRLSTKSATGKCQGCGLKKCKKTCMFFTK